MAVEGFCRSLVSPRTGKSFFGYDLVRFDALLALRQFCMTRLVLANICFEAVDLALVVCCCAGSGYSSAPTTHFPGKMLTCELRETISGCCRALGVLLASRKFKRIH